MSWNDIRVRAAGFSDRWADAVRENADAQTFWNEFLGIYGIDRLRVAEFELRVDGLARPSGRGKIDLLWPGVLVAEHKTRGRNLDEATAQALEYVQALELHQKPQFVAISDFEFMRLHNVTTGESEDFALSDLPRHIEKFGFLIGKQLRHQHEADPVNVHAARKMSKLHNLLESSGYAGHALELLLVRMLFLLFGDRTGLWDQRGLFYDLLSDHTRSDGDDTGSMLARLFQVLNTPETQRQVNLPECFKAFPYVNGELFAEPIGLADFSPEMRQILLEACTLDWGQVSPAIFGSMFQAVMDATERRSLGAHYTSETNIFKALNPLLLEELRELREKARGHLEKVNAFLKLLPRIRIFDPACGSGNFLILAYRELRRLELDALLEKHGIQPGFDISTLLKVNVGQCYGIEVGEFSSQIARVAMWLTDHQMNLEASYKLGQNFVNLPLTHAAHILNTDALEADWFEHLNLNQDGSTLARVYVVGNPPFIGSSNMTAAQRRQVVSLFRDVPDAGQLDFVAAWYIKAARLLNRIVTDFPEVKVSAALVATNSIAQGVQVPPLMGTLLRGEKMAFSAAHQTFKWSNEAPGQAAVHCVIVQFEPAASAPSRCRLFSYIRPDAAPLEHSVSFINAYLTDGPDVIVTKRSRPFLSNIQRVVYGNKPVDDGNLFLESQAEYDELVTLEPGAAKFIKPVLGAKNFMHGQLRWVLWLVNAQPHELIKLPRVLARVKQVKEFRLASSKTQTQTWAARPTEFMENRHPSGPYLVIPRHTSESYLYVPFGYENPSTVVTDAVFMLPNADLLTFGLISSAAHMAWLHAIGGRIKSDYRFSSDLVYNTLPWPDRTKLSAVKIKAIEKAAQAVLDARAAHLGSTLAQLYGPLTIPRDLLAAHSALDRATDAVFGIRAGATEAQRLSRLLALYQEETRTLLSVPVAKPVKRRRTLPTSGKLRL